MKSPNISEDYVLHKRKELGQTLKSIREAQGLTMEQLGEQLSVSKSTVSKVESGKWNLGVDTLIMFSVALGVDIDIK